MSEKKHYKIGTRGSLLAVTQCTLTKNSIEENSNLTFELEKIKTQGDQQTDKPLWQLEGKDFFTKELDEALLNKNVDMVVHSYKDLGSIRPRGIKLTCIPERTFAHDVLLIKKSTIERLNEIKEFRLGTSSPRRIENIGNGLVEYLPHFSGKIVPQTLRGNVNTRIEKLLDDQYEAIVLAFAGLERLASFAESAKVLKELVRDLNFMVLPIKPFPPAASQGALAIETHEENTELHQSLEPFHSSLALDTVARERKAFNDYGGGCHLAVGVHVKKHHDFYLHFHKGTVDHTKIETQELEGFNYPDLTNKLSYYMFSDFDFLLQKKSLNAQAPQGNLFVTSQYCIDAISEANSLWSGGNRTMRKLISRGFWVNGSSEGFGHEEILNFKKSKFINLILKPSAWFTLSHNRAESSVGDVIACYSHEVNTDINEDKEQLLLESDIVYWSSKIQFETYTKRYPELLSKLHASGLGKTYTYLKDQGLSSIPCIDMNHLKQLTKAYE